MSHFQDRERAGGVEPTSANPFDALPAQPTLGEPLPDAASAPLPQQFKTDLQRVISPPPDGRPKGLREMLLEAQGRDPEGDVGLDTTPVYGDPSSVDLRDYVSDLVEQFKDQAWDHEARERAVRLAGIVQVKFAERLTAQALGNAEDVQVADRELRMAMGAIEAMAAASALTGAGMLRRAIWDWSARLVDMLVSRIVPPASAPNR